MKSATTLAIAPILAASMASPIPAAIQIQTQTQTQSKAYIIVQLPKLSPNCEYQTRIMMPESSDWDKKLANFQTCATPMTITVLLDGSLLITSEGVPSWRGRLNAKGESIEPIKTPIN